MGKLPVFLTTMKNDLAFKIMIKNLLLLINNINICSSTT